MLADNFPSLISESQSQTISIKNMQKQDQSGVDDYMAADNLRQKDVQIYQLS